MTLDEQLAMAVNTAPAQPVAPAQPTVPVQPAPVAQPVQPVAPVQPTVQQATPVNPAVIAQTLDLDQASQEAETTYAMQSIEIGQKISSRPIDPLRKLDKGQAVRITVLNTTDWKAVPIHKHEELGKILCWKGLCCKDSDPSIRYCIPIVVYSTLPNDVNVAVPQGKSELKLLVLWDTESYDSLSECIINAGSDVTTFDLQAKAIDNYGKLMFSTLPTSFRPQFAQDMKDAEEKWANIKDRAFDIVGRKLNDEKYRKLTTEAPMPQLSQYNSQDLEISNL